MDHTVLAGMQGGVLIEVAEISARVGGGVKGAFATPNIKRKLKDEKCAPIQYYIRTRIIVLKYICSSFIPRSWNITFLLKRS